MRLRLSVLLAGAPAMTPQQFAKSPRRPIVGTSLTLAIPTGQYYQDRLVNLGTNRWALTAQLHALRAARAGELRPWTVEPPSPRTDRDFPVFYVATRAVPNDDPQAFEKRS